MLKPEFVIASLSLIILLTCTNLAAGQIQGNGKCPNVSTFQRFDLKQFVGKWVVVEKLRSVVVPPRHCQTAKYTLVGKDNISVSTTALEANNKPTSADGTGKVVGAGKLVLNIDFGGSDNTLNLWVIATDYKTYASIYSCSEKGGKYTMFVFVFARDWNPSGNAITAAETALAAQGLPTKQLVKDKSVCV